ncbi:unnamed protein product [Rotaria magnacalcarata]|uniref:Mos1 transposase HTH domain-containing protein n=2 Tax=Rotaria magnacalcarata TaxID=392030 RepID=A0A819CQX9_9BILA|nr:unnamed protein product [Rotaria magnacalcarata]CAF3816626.1 unnamed protein product [Rotaria magnacalcarata]CAF3901794.1 unnamed protein product [Rotaria magnacalcarata]
MIYYDYKNKLSHQECLESLQKTFGDSCVSRATVYNWYAEFNRDRDHFEDEPRVGRPRSAVTPENIEAIRQLINDDPHINRYRTPCLRKITCRWVPHFLTETQKQDRVDYCLTMLEKLDGGRSKRAQENQDTSEFNGTDRKSNGIHRIRCRKRSDPLVGLNLLGVYDIITGDESWFNYYDPEIKRQSQVWVARTEHHPTKVRRQRSVGKHMFPIFFMKSGFNTIIPLENGKTVTAKWYTDECLSNALKPVEKRRHLNDLIIHHGNALARKATQTMEYLNAQRVKLMGHPTYSPDIYPGRISTVVNDRIR